MQTSTSLKNSLLETAVTLVLGALIGVLTYVFIEMLTSIGSLQGLYNAGVPYHLFLLPVVLVLIDFTKKNSLYFPTKVSQLTEENTAGFWTPFMTVFHFFGTLFGHLAGASLGREGAVVLFSAGLVRAFRLSWAYWGPIASAIGFSSVVGSYWVAPFFMGELFLSRTDLKQKLYALMGALMASTVLQSLKAESLFGQLLSDKLEVDIGFFKKLLVLFVLGAMSGYLMRLYKTLYFQFTAYFKKSLLGLKVFIAALMGLFLYIPEFRKFQGLGLPQFTDLVSLQPSLISVVSKLFLTLLSTTLGFFGGEFIPLIFTGVHLGGRVFEFFSLSPYLGCLLGAYLLFAGGTRFKWTSYILILSLLGFSWWFWGWFVVMVTISFSGGLSLYKQNL